MAISRTGVIQIDFSDFESMVRDFDRIETKLMQEMEEEMKVYSLLVETGARALAHRFGGDLEESIISEPVKRRGGIVIGAVGSNLVYAWRRHEEPGRPGKHPLYDNGAKIEDYYKNGLGRRTRQKLSWRGEMPGRKFLERAVVLTEDDFEESMDRALAKALEGFL